MLTIKKIECSFIIIVWTLKCLQVDTLTTQTKTAWNFLDEKKQLNVWSFFWRIELNDSEFAIKLFKTARFVKEDFGIFRLLALAGSAETDIVFMDICC